MTLPTLARKRIKVALNGGALNPRGLAAKVAALAEESGCDLRVAYVAGDDLLPLVGRHMPTSRSSSALLPHLDGGSERAAAAASLREAYAFLGEEEQAREVVSANAYLGARGIAAALREGADVVVCGRVSDASPVVGAAWYWWGWGDGEYDALAGALVAGHLIECSAYVTGGNFAGFQAERYGGVETFLHPGFPIAEVERDGSCVVTKHEGTGGVVDEDTVRCQLLYELQGNVYLHSDVKAVLDGVVVEGVGKDRWVSSCAYLDVVLTGSHL